MFENNFDKTTEYIKVDFEINLNKNGFQIFHNNKAFICQTGSQLIAYLKSVGVSDGQLLGLQELLLKECMRRGLKFPKKLMD